MKQRNHTGFKLSHRLRYLGMLICLLMVSVVVKSQKRNVREALRSYFSQDYITARVYIDSAAVHDETKDDANTWCYRGFIYKELYTETEKSNPSSILRITALESYKKYFAYDVKNDLYEQAKIGYDYLCQTLYNDAATALNNKQNDKAVQILKLYKLYKKIIDPEHDFNSEEIEFNMVLGQNYTETYNSDPVKYESYFNKIRNLYLFVLDIDSNHWGANYNLGILYYNKAVDIIDKLDYETDLITLDLIEDECAELFKKALPYMQRAYNLNPKRRDVLSGLAGIYFSLNELDKSQEIKKELELLDEK